MSVEIIAEIGINHNGDFDTAVKLIDRAVTAGADTVKFQIFDPESESSYLYCADYIDRVRECVLSGTEMLALRQHASNRNVGFLCTPSDEPSLDWMLYQGFDRIKIGSDNLTNTPLLRRIRESKKFWILSTGMATLNEVDHAVNVLSAGRAFAYGALLHCTSAYPAPVEDVNLSAIMTLINEFNAPVGWSDHTTSTTLAAVAVGLGAMIIEKHITLSRHDRGPDHAASLEPDQFFTMVRNIREVETAFGSGFKRCMPSEAISMRDMRKSLTARNPIADGAVINRTDIAIQRPGHGMSPFMLDRVVGTVAKRSYRQGELL